MAYNLLEGHRELSPLRLLTELRKVRPGHFKDLSQLRAPSSQANVASALPHTGGPEADLSLLFLLLSSTWRGTPCGSTLHTE